MITNDIPDMPGFPGISGYFVGFSSPYELRKSEQAGGERGQAYGWHSYVVITLQLIQLLALRF